MRKQTQQYNKTWTLLQTTGGKDEIRLSESRHVMKENTQIDVLHTYSSILFEED
jgi:hypothetical protein